MCELGWFLQIQSHSYVCVIVPYIITYLLSCSFFVKNEYVNILLLINKVLIVDITLGKNDQAGEVNHILAFMYVNLEL